MCCKYGLWKIVLLRVISAYCDGMHACNPSPPKTSIYEASIYSPDDAVDDVDAFESNTLFDFVICKSQKQI